MDRSKSVSIRALRGEILPHHLALRLPRKDPVHMWETICWSFSLPFLRRKRGFSLQHINRHIIRCKRQWTIWSERDCHSSGSVCEQCLSRNVARLIVLRWIETISPIGVFVWRFKLGNLPHIILTTIPLNWWWCVCPPSLILNSLCYNLQQIERRRPRCRIDWNRSVVPQLIVEKRRFSAQFTAIPTTPIKVWPSRTGEYINMSAQLSNWMRKCRERREIWPLYQ